MYCTLFRNQMVREGGRSWLSTSLPPPLPHGRLVLFQAPFVFNSPTHSFIHSLVICPLVYIFVCFLFTCLPVALFAIYSFTYLSIYLLFVHLFYFITDTNPLSYLFYLFIYLFVHLFTSPPARQLIHPFTYLFGSRTNPFIYPIILSIPHSFILEFAPIFSNSRQFSPIRGYSLPSLVLYPALKPNHHGYNADAINICQI